MSEAFDRNDIHQLFCRLADGAISPEEHRRLETQLSQHPEARAQWFRFADQETGLADWAAIEQHREAGPAAIPPGAPTATPVVASSLDRGKDSADRRSFVRTWTVATAGAALAAAMLLAVLWRPQPAAEELARGVAVLTRTVDAVWSDSDALRSVGAVLRPGELTLKSGAVLLEFYSGARLVVEGPARLRLVSTSELFLASGRINAHVPPQATGFTVAAADFRLIDRGTDFGLVVSAEAAAVHVFEGAVAIALGDSATPVRVVDDGRAAELRAQTWKEIPSDRAAFLEEDEIIRRQEAAAETRRDIWNAARRRLGADPAMVVHYTFHGPTTEGEWANQAPDALPATNGRSVGCDVVAGRWEGKKAVQFRNEGDRIRLRVERPLREVTLMAWVRVQSLRRGLQSLLSADSTATGSLRWELSHQGRLRLGIARDLGRPRADWEAVDGAPFVAPERFGQWLFLASTFDGETVKHYGDGVPAGEGAAFTPPAILVGAAEIGNGSGAQVRFFPGAIDEFAILSRVLSAEEVRLLYEQGKQ